MVKCGDCVRVLSKGSVPVVFGFNGLGRVFRPRSGAVAFFLSILIWGIGVGSFMAALNNFLYEVHGVDQQARGLLEFFREMPGVFLVVSLALLHRVSDWRIMRIETLISLVGVTALCFPVGSMALVTLFVVTWSLGEHLVMPVRSAIAMQVAREGQVGASLGVMSGVSNGGCVLGSLLVAGIFLVGERWFEVRDRQLLYNVVWGLIACLMAVSVAVTFTRNAPSGVSRRPAMYFSRLYGRFYLLELFYGARKQIFLTFAPYVLISLYGFTTAQVALLLGVSATLNIATGPLLGRLCDRVGYRLVMIYDTVVLLGVCLLYGFAHLWFTPSVAVAVVAVNFLLDGIISQTTMAGTLYVRALGGTHDEVTSTLSTGISINHVISIFAAWAGGWVWQAFGVEWLFVFAGVMCVANSLCAMTIPRVPERKASEVTA